MRYFQQIAAGVDVLLLTHALQRQPELWNRHRFRTTYPNTPHGDVDDIWIRFSDESVCTNTTRVIGDDHPVWHEAVVALPQVKPIVLDLMRRVDGYDLGRVLITRLRPGGRILPHSDSDGPYVNDADRARYHVVLQGLPGSLYRVMDETVCMQTGTVWWFDALKEHEIINNSADDRIHLLVDIRTWPSSAIK